MKKYLVKLTQEEVALLEEIIRKGKRKAQVIRNALILLNVNQGKGGKNKKDEDVSEFLNVTVRTIEEIRKRFVLDDFEIALYGKPSPRVYEKKADGEIEAHLIALSCSDPPQGYAKWSLRLLADKMVELNYIDSLSHETVRRVLKKTN